MRRKITLYIDGRKADLQDDSLVLFNYTREDLERPTVVKNSYSQQITLPGTPANNRIFGHLFRPDRTTAYGGSSSGPDYNPMRKTPFVIFEDTGEVLEAGYVKLDSVDRTGPAWHVTLYGGLGSFLFGLSYDESGNRRTLADLDYLGTGNSASELDFTINAATVAAAWAAVSSAHQGDVDSIWKVINFAPCYNGIPEKDFDAKAFIAAPSAVGLPTSVTDGGVTYSTKGGYSLFHLPEKVDEWAVKDLRSYLQRPVLSMRAFLAAIANPDNNGGYSVDLSALEDTTLFPYANLWKTLPQLPALWGNRKTSGDVSLVMASDWTVNYTVATYTLSSVLPSGTTSAADLHIKLRARNAASEDTLYLGRSMARCSILFIQAVGYDSLGAVMAVSDVQVAGGFSGMGSNYADWAAAAGYQPILPGSVSYQAAPPIEFDNIGGNDYESTYELAFHVEGLNIVRYAIMVTGYRYENGVWSEEEDPVEEKYIPPSLYTLAGVGFTTTGLMAVAGDTADAFSYSSPSQPRSNSKITKEILLSTSSTPAEYLLSFCKVFGLSILVDAARKAVTLLRRNDLYVDETVDLSRRVDRSHTPVIVPLVASSRWYRFALQGVEGAFAKEYADVRGFAYGVQRVNTGYEFNADTQDLMDSVVFRSCATVLGRSKYWNRIASGATPSVFVDSGNTYTLWASDGKSLDVPISVPAASATVDYYNADFPGCDIPGAGKPEFRDADGKALDGADVLLFYDHDQAYPQFHLSDDTSEMDTLNKGVPCWLHQSSGSLTLPVFGTYLLNADRDTVTGSLDFGAPLAMDYPGMAYDLDSTIYARAWKAYLADRFNTDTKVMTCRVDFRGIQVGPELLRKFYWYEGSLWTLNKITNYSLTTYDPVECEFVQVQDKDNYLNGQF